MMDEKLIDDAGLDALEELGMQIQWEKEDGKEM